MRKITVPLLMAGYISLALTAGLFVWRAGAGWGAGLALAVGALATLLTIHTLLSRALDRASLAAEIVSVREAHVILADQIEQMDARIAQISVEVHDEATELSGEVRMLVAATGRHTELGGIAAALDADEPPTAFERGLRSLGLLIVRLTIFLVLFVLLAQIAFHRPPLESFLFAVALAVGLTPELLPMVTTVTLSRGAVRMARRKVIVKKLSAIHDLGAMDVL